MPSLRGYRGLLTFLAAAIVIALISAFGFGDGGAGAISSIDPGGISGVHQNFTAEEGCATCHKPHASDAGGWMQASWSPASLSQSCESCHAFNGPASAPHNEQFKTAGAHRKTECTMCHTEHKGRDAKITQLSDSQCSACHEKQFKSFSQGHPGFSKDFPSRRRTAIAFDHTSHLSKHFQKQGYLDRAPKEKCIACHDTSKAARNVPVRPFEESRAQCHEDLFAKRELVLFTLPEFERNPFNSKNLELDADEAKQAADKDAEDSEIFGESCGPSADESALAVSGGDFESVSTETLPPTALLLLEIEDGEDIDAYTKPIRELIMGTIENGAKPLIGVLEKYGDPKALLSGLSPELLRQIGCAWAANVEYEAPADAVSGGWFADEFSLKYRPVRHADPVSKAWLNLAAAGGEGVTDDVRDTLLSRLEGPGGCAKCHSVSQDNSESEKLRVEWSLGAQSKQRHLNYSHGPHLNLLGPGASCESCHELNDKANYASAFKHKNPLKFESNFKSIENGTCSACHAEDEVRQECTLCHEYHNGNAFKRRMTSAGKKESGN